MCIKLAGSFYTLSKVGVLNVKDSSYFFYIAYYTTLVTNLGIPLLNVYKIKNRTLKVKKYYNVIRIII